MRRGVRAARCKGKGSGACRAPGESSRHPPQPPRRVRGRGAPGTSAGTGRARAAPPAAAACRARGPGRAAAPGQARAVLSLPQGRFPSVAVTRGGTGTITGHSAAHACSTSQHSTRWHRIRLPADRSHDVQLPGRTRMCATRCPSACAPSSPSSSPASATCATTAVSSYTALRATASGCRGCRAHHVARELAHQGAHIPLS